MLNIVIPMAGRGSRFSNAGYITPKPLIPIAGKPMIQWVIENIGPQSPHRFIFICQKTHLQEYPEIKEQLKKMCPNGIIIELEGITEGAACTVLSAKKYINNDDSLMIANADQYVDCDINDYIKSMNDAQGLIMTFPANDPKWSYCRTGLKGNVTEVVEKQVVSNLATVGIYNFKKGKDFVDAAETMIAQNIRVNGEFYVAPVYNFMIQQGAKIVTYSIAKEGEGMHGLGTPEDLECFLDTRFYKKMTAFYDDQTYACSPR